MSENHKPLREYLIKYLWFFLLLGLIIYYREDISHLLHKVHKIKVSEVEVELEETSKIKTLHNIDFYIAPKKRKALLQRASRIVDELDSMRILWVDDHPENHIEIKRLLESFNISVDMAYTSSSALEILNKKKDVYNLIISDNCRDKADDTQGVIFAQQYFSEGAQFSEIPLIIFSGHFSRVATILPFGVFASTYKVEELLQYIFDVAESGGISRGNLIRKTYSVSELNAICNQD